MLGVGRFGGVVTAMITPFDDHGRLDIDGAVELAKWLTSHGSDGLVLAGTTGEAPVLSDAEKRELWEAVARAVTVPVVANSGTNDTEHSVKLTKSATEAGVAGILAVTPYYNRPSQLGMEAHFRAIAASTPLPVMIYDIPVRTGRKVANETLLRLARDVANIVGVKDAAGDVPASARLIAQAGPSFQLYSGDDSLTLPLLAVGAVGVIGVATHWAGTEFSEMITAFHSGKVEAAQEINARLVESCRFEGSDLAPNPVPTKAMMRVMGLPAGECRLPMGPTPPGLEEEARGVLSRLGHADWLGKLEAPRPPTANLDSESATGRFARQPGTGQGGGQASQAARAQA